MVDLSFYKWWYFDLVIVNGLKYILIFYYDFRKVDFFVKVIFGFLKGLGYICEKIILNIIKIDYVWNVVCEDGVWCLIECIWVLVIW